jgi:hypothetical protein
MRPRPQLGTNHLQYGIDGESLDGKKNRRFESGPVKLVQTVLEYE